MHAAIHRQRIQIEARQRERVACLSLNHRPRQLHSIVPTYRACRSGA